MKHLADRSPYGWKQYGEYLLVENFPAKSVSALMSPAETTMQTVTVYNDAGQVVAQSILCPPAYDVPWTGSKRSHSFSDGETWDITANPHRRMVHVWCGDHLSGGARTLTPQDARRMADHLHRAANFVEDE